MGSVVPIQQSLKLFFHEFLRCHPRLELDSSYQQAESHLQKTRLSQLKTPLKTRMTSRKTKSYLLPKSDSSLRCDSSANRTVHKIPMHFRKIDKPTELTLFLQEALRSGGERFLFYTGGYRFNDDDWTRDWLQSNYQTGKFYICRMADDVFLSKHLAFLTNSETLLFFGLRKGLDDLTRFVEFPKLVHLALESCDVDTEGVEFLSRLSNLTSLNVNDNQIGVQGAESLSRLSNLTSLSVDHNQIGDQGVEFLSRLSNLTSLSVEYNQIGDQGAEFPSRLSNLTSLNVDRNQIGDQGAESLSRLSNLTSLDLYDNQIGEKGLERLLGILAENASADYFKHLNVRGNSPLEGILPKETLETSDAQAIFAAFRRYQEAKASQTLRPLNEAKLLVVGNEAVGKTSLIKFLAEETPCNPNEKETRGTEITEKIETRRWLPGGESVSLNIWDFGGQEIMRGTHRYFLTDRSLYLLVLDDRRQDDEATALNWLKVIANRAPNSPVIVVINKSDEGKSHLRLAEEAIKSEYEGRLVAFVRTSCNDDDWGRRSVEDLRQLIVETLAGHPQLKHIRDKMPESWLSVKGRVAAMAEEQSYLEHADFARICEDPEVTGGTIIEDSNEQRSLLRLLHDLGTVVAHGLDRDAPAAAREVQILDPNWLTTAIYTILLSYQLRDQKGVFTRDNVSEWLDPEVYPPERHELILLMMQDEQVGLCFPLEGQDKESYLVPEALQPDAPDYEGLTEGSLHFRYRYDFLPKGLIPRFIVQTYRSLSENPTLWKTGVVLSVHGCKVLVVGNVDERKIDVWVMSGNGGRRRDALNVILDHLDYVHEKNQGAGPKAVVPLPDQPELEESYEHLLNLEEDEGSDYSYRPTDAKRKYTISELLDGVRREDRKRTTMSSGRSEPLAEPMQKAPWWSQITGWIWFSVACGGLSALVTLLYLLLPYSIWKMISYPAFAFALVTTGLMLFNPATIIRRLLGLTVTAGLAAIVFSGQLELLSKSIPYLDNVKWSSSYSAAAMFCWVAVVAVLAWLEFQQQKSK